MAKRRAAAVAEDREPFRNDDPETPKEAPPSREQPQTPWRMSMVLWGFPLLFFITMAVLKECLGVSFW